MIGGTNKRSDMGAFAKCPKCDSFLVPGSLICLNQSCSTNRPTDRPKTSQPSAEDKTEVCAEAANPCKLCKRDMPEKARYCPYCRAPTRASATAAYHVWEHVRLPQPPLPRIEEIDEENLEPPPTPRDAGHSGFRRKIVPGASEPEASCSAKKGR